MNVFHKLFCRIYQTCFHMALPVLPYREPERITSLEQVAQKLQEKERLKPFVITDKFLSGSDGFCLLKETMEHNGICPVVYDKTNPNPTIDNVEEAKTLYVTNRCNAIVAYGGGSPMDCAKAMGALIAYPKKSLKQLKGNLKVWRKLPLFIAIPTTAGTGSEVTVTSVITDGKIKYKYTMNNFSMIPHYVVFDPKVTVTLPKHLTATTGMDALTHAVEAYIGKSSTNETRMLSENAVKLVFENIEKAYENGEDLKARENMQLAAYQAGIAFSKSYVGYIHAVAHSLGGQYNTPHGLANAVLLPVGLEIYGDCIYDKLYKLAICAGVALETDTKEAASKKFIQAIYALNKRLNIPNTIPEIQEADIPIMASHAAKEGNPLYPVPKLMDREELKIFYFKVKEGTSYAN